MSQELDDFFSIQVDLRAGAENATPPKRQRRARAERRPHDSYPTFPAVAKAIVDRVAMYCPLPVSILEPTAGEGAFVKACRERWADAKIGAVDIDGKMREPCGQAGASVFLNSDILTVPREQIEKFTLIIGNLPFADSAKILRHIVNPHSLIAILLPVSFFGWTVGSPKFPTPRDAEFWKACRITCFAPIAPRPSFTNDGRTDRMEYGLFGFGDWGGGSPWLGPAIVWEK